ncbi:MAG: TraB/GumN family protein, partial [Proteobacteria bacterium]|nr:TraB/GumN family protein [Pseudomonadota bacterium]
MQGSFRVGRAARFAAIAMLALLVSACATQRKAPSPLPKPGDELAPKAFFWEAQSENGARLFLLGSVHIGDGRELVLDPRIEKDWAEAHELVVELDTTTLSPVDAVDATNRFGLLPRGTTLRDVVNPDTYKQVAKYMKQREYPIERIDRMRPWLVAQVVTQLEYAAAGLEAENGVDVAMMRRATGRKGIVPLESLEEQAALFAGLPAPLQEKMLVEILREAQALLAVTRATLAAWEQGDEETLSGLLFSNASGDAVLTEFYERVFYGRNRAMTDRLVTISADGRPRFVVVGTGHLIGSQGIPELLAQRGFRVERVGSARVLPGTIAAPAGAIPAPSATPVEPAAPQPTAAPVAPVAPSGTVTPAAASDTPRAIPPPAAPTVPPATAQPASPPTAPYP